MTDTRIPCKCGNPTGIIGEPTIPGTQFGRLSMNNDFRYINGELIRHLGYDGRDRAGLRSQLPSNISEIPSLSTQELISELNEIEEINNSLPRYSVRDTGSLRGLTGYMGTSTSNRGPVLIDRSKINPKNNGDNSIIKKITISGESNCVGYRPDWNANSWQNDNIELTNGRWLSTETPYIFNFGKFDQFGRTISVEDITENKNGEITWAITVDGVRIRQHITLIIEYTTNFYGNKMKSIAELDLIDIGDSFGAFAIDLSCKKTLKDNNNKSNIVMVQYDISWSPVLQTITDPDENLKQQIKRLSNFGDELSKAKLETIMENINEGINDTKLGLLIRYG